MEVFKILYGAKLLRSTKYVQIMFVDQCNLDCLYDLKTLSKQIVLK